MTDTIDLPRKGNAPLRFRGELLSEADSKTASGPCQNRWHELKLYRLADGGYVLAIGFRSSWQGEAALDDAIVCQGIDAVRIALQSHDPNGDYEGYPPGEHYDEKRRRLHDAVLRGYQMAVSNLLDEFPEEVEADPEWHLRERRDLRRYRRLLDEALSTVRLTVPEAALICDANNGIGSFSLFDQDDSDADLQSLVPNVADSISLNQSDRKWGVDGGKLVGYLEGLERIQLLAIADAVERWWRLPDADRDTLADGLASVGLVQ